jgi:amino acid adenylation domain-containing protein
MIDERAAGLEGTAAVAWPPHALARHAAERPDAPAVVDGTTTVSYRELDRRAGQVAAALVAGGIGTDDVVAVLTRRSWETVAAVCGILRAGGASLLLESAYPDARLQRIVDDSGAAMLLGHTELLATRHLRARRTLELEACAGPALASGPAGHPAAASFAIYTSGSTGAPKGAILERLGVENVVRASLSLFSITPAERLVQFASVGFDVATWDMLCSVTAGATLVVYPRTTVDVADLAAFVGRERVSMAMLPPSVVRLLDPAGVPSLRTVISVGEACTADIVERWAGGDRRLFNGYGPSEVTILTTVARCAPGEARTPIGHLVPGLRAHVLDDELREVPDGRAGGLFVGGPGVGRGYAGRPALTAERYVPDPFGPPGSRLYPTGDVCRRRPDGQYEYLGRRDNQVKVHGQRIELEEIELVLRGAPGARDAAVVFRDRRLAGYVVPHPGVRLDAAAIRAHLRATLPGFMVPALAAVDALPLNPHGKVDRAALPPLTGDVLLREGPWTAPATPTERLVAEVVGEVMGIAEVGGEEDFLALGGDSLAANALAARLDARLGRAVPARAVLELRTVTALAAHLDGTAARPSWPPIEPLDRASEVAPVSFAQERLLFLRALAPAASRAYQGQVAVRLRGPLDVPRLRAALGDVVRRHEIFRTTFDSLPSGEAVQRVHDPRPAALPEIDLSQLGPGPARDEMLERHLAGLFAVELDISRLPLARWTLLRLAPAEHVLVSVEHHLVHDGWSVSVFLRDLFRAYRHRCGEAPPPPEPSLQFRDLAAWQRLHVSGEREAEQLGYWRSQLAGSAATALPTGAVAPGAGARAYRGSAIHASLPPDLVRAAADLARARGVTLFTLTFAAFSALLHRLTGEADVTVGTSAANRRRPESEDLAGMVVNNVALRTRLAPESSFAEHVEHAHGVVLAALEHQDVPLQRVVRAVNPERGGGDSPLFRVMFNFLDAPRTFVPPAGLDVDVREMLPNGTAKFDLNVELVPRGPAGRVGAVDAVIEYDDAAVGRETAEETWRSYLALLAALVGDPEAPVAAGPLLDAGQRERVARLAGAAAAPSPAAVLGVTAAVWAQAERRPDDPAVADASRALTYRELTGAADRAAARLRAWGVGDGVPVGVRMRPSVDLVIALLATWRAGGVFVPVDAALPAERVGTMLRDAGVELVLTGPAALAETVGWGLDARSLEGLGAERPPVAGARRLPGVAYVMFTSGSTGVPKGIAVTRDNLDSLAGALSERLGADGAGETWVAATSPGFDISLVELVWPLTRGARVVAPAPPGAARPPRRLPSLSVLVLPDGGSGGPPLPDGPLAQVVRLADARGFEAVWVTHASPLPGRGANTALTGAAIAALTGRLHVRVAGVTPVDGDAARAAGEWALVDRLSGGRAGIGVALAPGDGDEHLAAVRAGWQGPVWLSGGGGEGFARAGRLGANVLAQLSGDSAALLRARIAAYRASRTAAAPGAGHVTLVLPAELGDGEPGSARSGRLGLFGGVDRCRRLLEDLSRLGVDEVACAVDLRRGAEPALRTLRALASLVEPPASAPRQPAPAAQLADLVLRHGASHVQCTPSMARLLLAEPRGREALASLRVLLLAGEPLAGDLAMDLVRTLAGGRLLNGYGPTEATVYATMADVTAELELSADGPVTIGRPLPNTTVLVLDERLQPLPPGLAGELHIGGGGVSAGYVGRPRETGERFVADPFAIGSPGRLYRTGDVVRMLADGRLAFVGRNDRQVKLNGYRIELAEVELALRRQADVIDAAVVLDRTGPEPALVAVVAASADGADPDGLRRRLRDVVPSYMVPSRIAVVPSLPLSVNGKVDRRAVERLAAGAAEMAATAPGPAAAAVAAAAPLADPPEAPAESVARVVENVWNRALRRQEVRREMDFFELGGHSMLALRVTSDLSAALGTHVPVSSLFEAPRLGDFTARVEALLP